jgi:hypothetical protein
MAEQPFNLSLYRTFPDIRWMIALQPHIRNWSIGMKVMADIDRNLNKIITKLQLAVPEFKFQ